MITVNAIGDTCPIPVVKTKKAIEALTQPDTVEILVDNEVAVENLKKMAVQKGYSCDSSKLDDGSYSVKLTIEAVNADELSDTDEASQYTCRPAADNRVVVIRSSYMGEGSEELGKVLIKGFIYALSQQDNPPETMLFYNGGAKLTCVVVIILVGIIVIIKVCSHAQASSICDVSRISIFPVCLFTTTISFGFIVYDTSDNRSCQ